MLEAAGLWKRRERMNVSRGVHGEKDEWKEG